MNDDTPRILVGFDGSTQSQRALRWAVKLANLTGSHIEAITAWQFPANYDYPFPDEGWAPDVPPQREFDAALEQVPPNERPANVRLSMHKGDPAQILIDRSRHATMLVVGNRGLGGFTSLLMGSVSAKCIHHSACPVLVVRGESESGPDQHDWLPN